jgi:hypothetical protein
LKRKRNLVAPSSRLAGGGGRQNPQLSLSGSPDTVKQHGGRIDVETEPGVFTEFIITLPRDSDSVTCQNCSCAHRVISLLRGN